MVVEGGRFGVVGGGRSTLAAGVTVMGTTGGGAVVRCVGGERHLCAGSGRSGRSSAGWNDAGHRTSSTEKLVPR